MALDLAAGLGQVLTPGLALMVGLIILSLLVHIFNLDRVFRRVSDLSGGQVSKDKMLEELSVPQGSNFTAMAISAWSLFFIAVAYFYFLTPAIFHDHNYFRVAELASSPAGFLIFGIVSMAFGIIVAVVFVRSYRYYEISAGIKRSIMVTFLLLGLSLICSAYIGTIYPGGRSEIATAAAFLALIASLVVLLSPIYLGAYKVVR